MDIIHWIRSYVSCPRKRSSWPHSIGSSCVRCSKWYSCDLVFGGTVVVWYCLRRVEILCVVQLWSGVVQSWVCAEINYRRGSGSPSTPWPTSNWWSWSCPTDVEGHKAQQGEELNALWKHFKVAIQMKIMPGLQSIMQTARRGQPRNVCQRCFVLNARHYISADTF